MYHHNMNLNSKTKNLDLTKGFTLVELLLVVAIIGILISFLAASFFGVRQKTQDAQRKTDLQNIQSALEQYRSDNGTYITDTDFFAIACGDAFTGPGSVVYMQKTPCDSEANTKYFYHTYNSGLSYVLVSCLENTDDKSGTATQPTYWTGTGASWPPASVDYPAFLCDPEYFYIVQNP